MYRDQEIPKLHLSRYISDVDNVIATDITVVHFLPDSLIEEGLVTLENVIETHVGEVDENGVPQVDSIVGIFTSAENYYLDVPIISDTYTLSNTYNYEYYTDLYEDNVSVFSLYLKSVDSIKNDDVKLSERIFLPSNKLRGFETGKIGPKDGNDFIGGNYATALNFSSTIPQLLENSQNIDVLFFLDAANVWGVDYDKSINDNSKIRSSFGIGVDWLTPIGPINFTFAEPITKANTDITETFRFNLGTTF